MSVQWVSAAVPIGKFVLVTKSNQNKLYHKFGADRPESLAQQGIEKLYRLPRG